jgi:hypothetical protein
MAESTTSKRSLGGVAGVRVLLARVVWAICVVFAVVLAVAVLLIAVKANTQNGLVRFDLKFSQHVDLHWFSLTNPIKDFDTAKKASEDVKTALFNYGLCAVVWLVIGRVLDRVIRP